MKFEFRDFIIASKEKFTADDYIDFYTLLKKESVVDLIPEDEKFLLVSQMLGVHDELRVRPEIAECSDVEATLKVDRIKEIMKNMTFKVEKVLFVIGDIPNKILHQTENDSFPPSTIHCIVDGETTLIDLSADEIEQIRKNSSIMKVNVGTFKIIED